MNKIDLDYAIGLIIGQKKPINKVLIIKKYIPIERKISAIDELFLEVFDFKDGKLNDIDPIKKYVKFTLLAVKLYTNLDLEGTYKEYDKLQSNGLIDSIFKEVKSDYMDLNSFMDMRFEHKIAQYYSSIQVGDMNGN